MDAASGAITQDAKDDPAAEVRRHLLVTTSGVLGTVAADERVAGYPFGSIVPFALDGRGRPLLQIARIAVHTRNVKADPRASLLVHEPGLEGDPQRGWRVTLLGKMEPVADAEREEALARFVERVPQAEGYERTHDFELWRLNVELVRYIGGFGRIHWVAAHDVLREPGGDGIDGAAPGAIAHMNADHASSMVDMCAGLYGFRPERAAMVQLERAGFFVRTGGPDRLVWFSFGREIGAADVRHAVVDVVKRARARAAAAPAGTP
jgi:hypothetical protein